MIHKQRLENGLRVITETMPQVRSVALGVWLRRGSRHEPASLNGVSHFIEHVVFKGTESRTGREIALAMDSIGGQMDAFTSKEYTCFYAKVLDEHVPEAVDLLSDIVRNPRFDADEIERERQVVLEEIRMVEDSPEELVYDLFSAHFYPRHPLGRPIQGTAKTVGALSRGRLVEFFRRAYSPGNILIVAAGNLKHERLLKLLRASFGSMPRTRAPRPESSSPSTRAGMVIRPKKDMEQLHLVLGLPGFPENFAERYPLFVLNAILGGTMSSRLFQRVREERGLAYSVYSAVNAFLDSGLLMVYAATSPSKAREVLEIVVEEMKSLREGGPQPGEIAVAKEHLKGSLMLSLESTVSRMSNLARQELYFRRQFTLSDVLRGLDAVTPASVHAMARRVFRNGHLALAAVGRVGRLRLAPELLRL